MHTERINFLDVNFDRISFKDAKDRLQATTSETPYAYIVTPNVDHVVRLHRQPRLRQLYEAAELCVCDSRILRLLARLSWVKLSLVPGSDLCAALLTDIAKRGDRIAIVGADRSCVEQLRERFPDLEFVHFEPPMGLRDDPDARRSCALFIAQAKPRFSLIAVGSPQQEMVASEVRDFAGATGLALCIGAGLDFLVGRQKRAPRWLQALGLEWAHRLASDPRRLWRRYLVEGLAIFPIWLRWRGSARPRLVGGAFLLLLALFAAAETRLHLRSSHADPASETVELPPPTERSVAAIAALPPPNLIKPVSPEEAAKENAERPFARRPDTAASRFVLRTDADDRNRAITCMAQAIYYEAAGEGADGGRAVAQVVLNRVRHPGFPSTICGVVYEGSDRPTGCQFSFTCDGSMQRIPVPWLWARSKEIAEQALNGRVYGAVGHATHYHADYVLPYWADSLDKSAKIGRHIFYRLRGRIGDAVGFSQRYGGVEPVFREPGAAAAAPETVNNEAPADPAAGEPVRDGPTEVAKASPAPSPPLLADSRRGALVADPGDKLPAESHRPKSQAASCATSGERKSLSPIRADDMRASARPDGC